MQRIYHQAHYVYYINFSIVFFVVAFCALIMTLILSHECNNCSVFPAAKGRAKKVWKLKLIRFTPAASRYQVPFCCTLRRVAQWHKWQRLCIITFFQVDQACCRERRAFVCLLSEANGNNRISGKESCTWKGCNTQWWNEWCFIFMFFFIFRFLSALVSRVQSVKPNPVYLLCLPFVLEKRTSVYTVWQLHGDVISNPQCCKHNCATFSSVCSTT